jgi:hypothetical protein
MVSVLFAFAAAFTSALNVVTQHVASTAATAKDKGWRLALYLVRNPLWLFGVAAMISSFVFQALALYNGQLSVVQSILVSELVFSLVIGSLWLGRRVAPCGLGVGVGDVRWPGHLLDHGGTKGWPSRRDGRGMAAGAAYLRRRHRRAHRSRLPRITSETSRAVRRGVRDRVGGPGHLPEVHD